MNNATKRMVSAALTATLALAPAAPCAFADTATPIVAQAVSWERLWGQNRYQTMAKIVQSGFTSSDTCVIACGSDFGDALIATGLAGSLRCPVILSATYDLSPDASQEISRLGASHAVIVGNQDAIADNVVDQLNALGVQSERVAGADLQATSAAVMRHLRASNKKSDTVVVASGLTFPDALSLGPWAWSSASPVLLCGSDKALSAEQVQELRADGGIRRIVIAGGPAAVASGVEETLGADFEVIRLGGANRYETSRLVAEWELQQGMSLKYPTIASGQNYPDALAGAAFAGNMNSVLLVADSNDDDSLKLLSNNSSSISSGYLLGGTSTLAITDPLGNGSTKKGRTTTKGNGTVQELIDFMKMACNDWSLGYDQSSRWDVYDGGECDCASLVYTALWTSGILTEPDEDERYGMTSTLCNDLTEVGWSILPADMSLARPGDILLNESSHVAVVVSGQGEEALIAHASGDEYGGATGGAAGDQLQKASEDGETKDGETKVDKIYDNSWDMILRLLQPGESADYSSYSNSRNGSSSNNSSSSSRQNGNSWYDGWSDDDWWDDGSSWDDDSSWGGSSWGGSSWDNSSSGDSSWDDDSSDDEDWYGDYWY